MCKSYANQVGIYISLSPLMSQHLQTPGRLPACCSLGRFRTRALNIQGSPLNSRSQILNVHAININHAICHNAFSYTPTTKSV